jgi:glycosyltransferase involved in cell wall biosynthesis
MYGNQSFFDLRPDIVVLQVKCEKTGMFRIPQSLMRIRKHLRTSKPDVIVSVDAALYIYAAAASIGLGLIHIVWEHFNFNISLGVSVRNLSRKLAARYSWAVVTLTQEDQVNWRTNLTCKAEIRTIPNPNPFENTILADVAENRVILSAGRLTHQKGFDRLLEAWQIAQAQNASGWTLFILGSGELEEQLRKQIEDLGIQGTVLMLPATADIASYYCQAGIFCLASRFEGFPMVLLEAQGFGLPLISYDCRTGPSEIISHHNGILVEDGNREALAAAIVKLTSDSVLRSQMAEASRANAVNYQIGPIAGKWVSLFEELS